MVRLPVVAGRFYEGEENILRQRIEDSFLKGNGPGRLPEGDPGNTRRLKALISPHAGFVYSGMPAAHSYLNLYEDGKPDHIVIIGPNHSGYGSPVAVCNDDWKTPLGVAKYDTALGPAIVEQNEYATNDCIAHSAEHSIEVQVPFLQYSFGEDFSFVPICLSDYRFEVIESLGKTIANLAKEMDILVIASSDFTHFESAASAKIKDNQALEYLEYLDPEGFMGFVREHRVSICGSGPIATALVFAKEQGATSYRLFKYTTSGDVTGDNNSVVAYVSGAFI
ncbi:MAG: AmmeMemoRadiSam system protein B [Candidatus Thorarchaeota archaeon]